jgi:hypothetical protein
MDNNFVPLRRMTLAEYNAQKYKIGSSDLTEITDSVDTPMAIGTNLMLSLIHI